MVALSILTIGEYGEGKIKNNFYSCITDVWKFP